MTKKEFRKSMSELRVSTAKMLRQYEAAALKSGALDLKAETAAYRLPKNVLTAALLDISDQWSPRRDDRAQWKEIRNIRLTTYPNFSS